MSINTLTISYPGPQNDIRITWRPKAVCGPASSLLRGRIVRKICINTSIHSRQQHIFFVKQRPTLNQLYKYSHKYSHTSHPNISSPATAFHLYITIWVPDITLLISSTAGARSSIRCQDGPSFPAFPSRAFLVRIQSRQRCCWLDLSATDRVSFLGPCAIQGLFPSLHPVNISASPSTNGGEDCRRSTRTTS